MSFFMTLFLLLNFSCEVIEGPYMLESNSNPIDTSSFVQKVLIEDFTGHRCRYCPSAARELSSIQNIYGKDRVIGIAIHPNSDYAKPDAQYTYDFRTEFGKDINMFFGDIAGSQGLPNGMINRYGYDSEYVYSYSQWGGIVSSQLEKDPIFGLNLSSDVTSTGNAIINVEIIPQQNLDDEHKLVICLTEDSIVSWQTDDEASPNDVENYIHNHVLRTMIGSFSGESLGSTFTTGNIITKDHTINLSELEQDNISYSQSLGSGNAGGWDYNNMHVIAYIYKVSNQEIVQVEESKLAN